MGNYRILVFPHPSGISHCWNEPGNMERTAKSTRDFLKKSWVDNGFGSKLSLKWDAEYEGGYLQFLCSAQSSIVAVVVTSNRTKS